MSCSVSLTTARRSLVYSRLNTARSWILFATVYSREFAELTGRHQLASPPEMEDCKSLIRAEPLNWGTTLITPSRRTDHVELSSIFEITNLLALELVFVVEPQFYPQVTNRSEREGLERNGTRWQGVPASPTAVAVQPKPVDGEHIPFSR